MSENGLQMAPQRSSPNSAECRLKPGGQEESESPHRNVCLVTDYRYHSWCGYDTINRCDEQSL